MQVQVLILKLVLIIYLSFIFKDQNKYFCYKAENFKNKWLQNPSINQKYL